VSVSVNEIVKLLWITERFPPDMGGVARSAGRIVRLLTTLDICVDVVTWSRYLQPGETLPPEASSTGHDRFRVHRLGLYRHWDMTLPHTLNLLDWLHHHQQYDAVWGHYLFPAGFVATWFGRLQGLPSGVSARGNDIDRGLFPPGDFARLQWTLANASLVTAVSQEMARKVTTLTQRPVRVQPNGVDVGVFWPKWQLHKPEGEGCGGEPAHDPLLTPAPPTQQRESLGILPGETVLGFSGELREKKGQRFLLQALTEVRALRPACLLIIGELRPEGHALLQRYASTHPEDAARVIVTGHLETPERVAQHLRLCDVYLQPSLWEGMPNALLEAMACGCGCIGSDAGGIPEIIDHGVTGFVLPRAQLHHLGRAVLEYLDLAPAVRAEIERRGCDRMHQRYTLTQERELLKGLMEELRQGKDLGIV
jgi:glycosyltransferase involved in cell wall biosynthesis